MRDLKSGLKLADRYTLADRLAVGGMAEVWRASDRLADTDVALKIVVDAALPAEVLRREWQLSVRLMHAHIARVFEFHEDEQGAFYALQYIDGPDASALSGGPANEILKPMALIADALRYAHGKGVVHRDIKAANILFDRNGAPYLIDFGVAAAPGNAIGGGSLIAQSPQQLAGAEPEPADDVFALGGLIYELVAGRSAYGAATTADDIRSLVPPPLEAQQGTLPGPDIQALVASMLDKDAGARPDAESVVDALKAAGIAGGPANRDLLGIDPRRGDENIAADAVIADRQLHRAAAAATPAESEGGLTTRAVGIALAALLAVLLGVIFLLPSAVDDTDVPADDAAAHAVTEAEQEAEPDQPEPEAAGDDGVPDRDGRVLSRQEVDETLGELLAKTRTLEGRAVERWGGVAWQQSKDAYAAGDEAYLARDYGLAQENYQRAIELVDPLLEEVDRVFERTLAEAETALDRADAPEALRLYELAVAITPSHGPARAGLARARNLDDVIEMTNEGLELERDLALDAAIERFEAALELDPEWQPARDALARSRASATQMAFDARMSEGLNALAEGDLLSARAAFRIAKELMPSSQEPADGLLQVDQGLRLQEIMALEVRAGDQEAAEEWQPAADTYSEILKLDGNLQFAKEGLQRANAMVELHEQLDAYIDDPDSLSSPRTMQTATTLVVDITRQGDIGPRLTAARDELSRLLKRAATPLTVEIVSDNATDVSIYRVGKLGSFASTELSLRPGTYVAVGSRPGFRDVRLEFRVAPEIDMQPIVVRCEEPI
ncbi:MAG: protein kinase [Pseudomonadota bacterium]